MILSIGAIALMAQFITNRLNQNARLLFHQRWKTFSLVVAILLLTLHSLIYPIMASTIRWVADPVPDMMNLGTLPDLSGKDLIVINSPSPGQSIYLLPLREVQDQSLPEHLRILAPAHTPVTVTRTGFDRLSIKPEDGFLLPTQIDFESDIKPFPLAHLAYTYRYGDAFFREIGQTLTLDGEVVLPGLTVQINSLTADGRPLEAEMIFEHALEGQDLLWLQWDWQSHTYQPFQIPEIGETIQLSGPF
jgi:hypothetical protein